MPQFFGSIWGFTSLKPPATPAKRFEKLITFCKANGLKSEQAFYENSREALKQF